MVESITYQSVKYRQDQALVNGMLGLLGLLAGLLSVAVFMEISSSLT